MPSASFLVTSSLVTGLVVTFLYGIFFILFIASTYFLFARHAKLAGPHNGNKLRLRYLIKPTILFNILMFICVTLVRSFHLFPSKCQSHTSVAELGFYLRSNVPGIPWWNLPGYLLWNSCQYDSTCQNHIHGIGCWYWRRYDCEYEGNTPLAYNFEASCRSIVFGSSGAIITISLSFQDYVSLGL
jgi:hypothetical protein